MKIQYKKTNPIAITPTRAHPTDAALDLYACLHTRMDLGPADVAHMATGIALSIPPGYCGVIKGRSGLASNAGVNILGGVIDAGYRGEIIVMLTVEQNTTFLPNQKIAQLLIVPVPEVELEEVPELTDTPRGENGFGSTDRNVGAQPPHGSPGGPAGRAMTEAELERDWQENGPFNSTARLQRKQVEYPGPENPGVKPPEPVEELPPCARPAPERLPGFVLSPFAPDAQPVDVRGFAPGQRVRDPHTQKIFLVPVFPSVEPPRAKPLLEGPVGASGPGPCPAGPPGVSGPAEPDEPGLRAAQQYQHGCSGAVRILRERERHENLGWTPEHDLGHGPDVLVKAARCYLSAALTLVEGGSFELVKMLPPQWPFERHWWKPSPDIERNLEKSGALTAAAIDRLGMKAKEEA